MPPNYLVLQLCYNSVVILFRNFENKTICRNYVFKNFESKVQIGRLRYAKICGERTLFHDLINNCPRKSENIKRRGSLRVLLLLWFPFRSSPPKLFSKVTVLKLRKIPLETPAVDFCFSCRT